MNRPNWTPADDWRAAAEAWVTFDKAARLLEGSKSSVLAKRVTDLLAASPKLALNRAEMQVKASKEWADHIQAIADARTNAEMAKIAMDYKKMVYFEIQSRQATERTEARL